MITPLGTEKLTEFFTVTCSCYCLCICLSCIVITKIFWHLIVLCLERTFQNWETHSPLWKIVYESANIIVNIIDWSECSIHKISWSLEPTWFAQVILSEYMYLRYLSPNKHVPSNKFPNSFTLSSEKVARFHQIWL